MKHKAWYLSTSILILIIATLQGCVTEQKVSPTIQTQSPEVNLEESESIPIDGEDSAGAPFSAAIDTLESSAVAEPVQNLGELSEEIDDSISSETTAANLFENHIRPPDKPIEQTLELTPPPPLVEEPSAGNSEQIVISNIMEPISENAFETVQTEPILIEPELSNERSPMQFGFILLAIIAALIIVLVLLFKKISRMKEDISTANHRITVFGIEDLETAQKKKKELQDTIDSVESQLIRVKDDFASLKGDHWRLEQSYTQLEKRSDNQKQKLARAKELYTAVEHAVARFHETEIPSMYYRPLTDEEKIDLETIAPSVMLNLNYMNYQELRKEFRANQKQIDALLEEYAQRYTTKANQAIYKLMVISLRSELQNILYNLKFEKLDTALLQVQSLIAKYLAIASDGNQQIAGTMRKFVGELEHLFQNAVKIEYEYYIKKEQVRQEQLALRQQMREEAEERRRLEEQKKQVAFEESKFHAEIHKVEELLQSEPLESPRREEISLKLTELHAQLAQVEEKKDEITKLQNGKAGNVYIISNLGSFGDHVFKVGMTRRLDPQDRVNELGDASVPFKFDVHSFIFSEDAVSLEYELHRRLNACRLNKVNLRKEFFTISLDELEQLVQEINPTAEFNRTMLAEDYHQSLSMGDQELPPVDLRDENEEQEDEEALEA